MRKVEVNLPDVYITLYNHNHSRQFAIISDLVKSMVDTPEFASELEDFIQEYLNAYIKQMLEEPKK